ncbi:MAG: sigma-70 family RNA polymerase sigma factor [Verrucomicrobiae bacterium]|nr:sigma-70 family RNA polymerase sigma factor [Verrucomicrobiae bacterium]
MTRLPDESLLAACLERGERQAFAVLVGRYQNLVCSVAYSIVGDLGQSEDVAQETFLAAWKQLKTLRDTSRFKSWLCGIARHLALAVVRKRPPETGSDTASAEDKTAPESSPDSLAAANEEAALVWEALAQLPETYREPLILFYREEQSIAKVAEDLELSEDAVKQRLSRGRALLRERVADLIEGTLIRTRPGPTFTLAVLAALPGFAATSAAAATLGTAGKATAVASSAASAGIFGGLLGGLLGPAVGFWISDQTARYEEQRQLLRRIRKQFFLVMAIFMLPWITLAFGWWSPADLGQGRYLVLWLTWMLAFFLIIGLMSWRLGAISRQIRAKHEAAGTQPLPPTPARQFLQRREGRRWNSPATFLGFPLVSIQFSDPDRDFSGYTADHPKGQRTARGWIAIGEKAIGLVAMGNIACGGIAFGGVSVGVLSFGGVALGGVAFGGLTLAALSLGGLALGIAAIGGLALGLWAYGGAAIAWIGSKGGVAIAREFALGGYAKAAEANSDAAKAYFEGHSVFRFGDAWLREVQQPAFQPSLWFLLLLGVVMILAISFRRKDQES